MSFEEILNKIEPAIKKTYEVNMQVKHGENILVVSDYVTEKQWVSLDHGLLYEMNKRTLLGRRIAEIGKEYSAELLLYPSTGQPGREVPRNVALAMKNADVILAPTSFSLTHTKATSNAVKNGARVASMPKITAEMFLPGGPMDADYNEISKLTKELCELGSNAKTARVVAKDTDITLELGREFWNDSGIYKPGMRGNLPAGEAFVAPMEGKSNGYYMVPSGWGPRLNEDIKFEVKEGLIADVIGGGVFGDKIREMLGFTKEIDEDIKKKYRNIAELGIGANPNAKRPDIVLEAEKIKGKVHIAHGSNLHFGGNIDCDLHLDCVIPMATLYFDKKLIIEQGKLMI